MAIGDDISQPIPAVSTAGTTYASQLVAFLQEVKSRLESKVPLSSILAGLLDMDNNAIENAQHVGLYEQDAAPDTVGSVYNYQGNLWYVSAAGAAQITSGNSLNAASLGGIDGDYGGGNPASLRFVDGDQTFYFYDDYGALEWARVAARSIDLYGSLGGTHRVRVTWGGSSNWTLTLPAAPPAASGTLLQMDTDGNVTAANTGLDNVTLAANKSVTVSGTGRLKHGNRIKYMPIVPVGAVVADYLYTDTGDGVLGTRVTGNKTIYCHLDFSNNDYISQIVFRNNNTGAASHTYSLVSVTAAGVESTVATTSGAGNTVTLTVNTALSSELYMLKIVTGAGACTFIRAEVTWSLV